MKKCYVCSGKGHQGIMFWKKSCYRCVGKGYLDPHKIIGVCLGWDLQPHIEHEDGSYLYPSVEQIIYKDYFKNGTWPTDPITGMKLPMAHDVYSERLRKEESN